MNNIHKKRSTYLGYIFAVFATIIWSGNFIVARKLNASIPPISLAFWRWFIAVIIFTPFALKKVILDWKIIKNNFPYLVITSVLGVSVFNTLIYFAGRTSSAINLSLISITFPIFIVIISRVLFKEKISLNKGFGIIIVVIGVLLLITKGHLLDLEKISFAIGDFWMLIAAIIFAIYSILLKYKPKNLSILSFQLTTFIIGLLFLVPFYIWDFLTGPKLVVNQVTITSLLYVGVFASLVAYILWNNAVANIGPVKAGIIYYTLPLFSGFFAIILLDEKIRMIHLYSMLLIISGILIANYTKNK